MRPFPSNMDKAKMGGCSFQRKTGQIIGSTKLNPSTKKWVARSTQGAIGNKYKGCYVIIREGK